MSADYFTPEETQEIVSGLIANGYHPIPVFEKDGELVPAQYKCPQTNVYPLDNPVWSKPKPAIAIHLGRSNLVLLDSDYRKKRQAEEKAIAIGNEVKALQAERHRLVAEEGESPAKIDAEIEEKSREFYRYKDLAEADLMDASALQQFIDPDFLRHPVQTNVEGDSIHWLGRLNGDVDSSSLKSGLTDAWPGVDIKAGNALMFIKPGKIIIDDELPPVDSLQYAPRAVVERLMKPTDRVKVEYEVPEDESGELLRENIALLNSITADKFEGGKLPRDVWRDCIAAWVDRWGANEQSLAILDEWSQKDVAGYVSVESVKATMESMQPCAGGTGWGTLPALARSIGGVDLSRSAAQKKAKEQAVVEPAPGPEPETVEVDLDTVPDDLWLIRKAEPSTTGELPEMILPTGEVTSTEFVSSVLTNLKARDEFYSRNGSLLQIMQDDEGSVKLDYIEPDRLRSEVEYGGNRLWKFRQAADRKSYELVPANLSSDNAKLVVKASRIISDTMHPLRLLRTHPALFLTDDNQCLLATQGYNPEFGGVYVSDDTANFRPMSVSEARTVILDELFGEFDFKAPEDKARAVACLLTPALVAAGIIKQPVPMALTIADESQTGKSYWHEVVAASYGEKAQPLLKQGARGVGGTEEKLSKVWKEGFPFVVMDNLKDSLNCSLLESAITAPDKVMARVAGSPDSIVSIRGVYMGMSSNGLKITKDLANRICIIRLKKHDAHFQFRDYPEGHLELHVRENVSRFLSAIYSIIAHWVRDGMPKDDHSGHDFREWASVVGGIAINYFGLPHPMVGHRVLAHNQSCSSIQFARLMAISLKAAGLLGERVKASDILGAMSHLDEEDIGWPSGGERQRLFYIGNQLKSLFGSSVDFQEREVEQWRITRITHVRSKDEEADHTYQVFEKEGEE